MPLVTDHVLQETKILLIYFTVAAGSLIFDLINYLACAILKLVDFFLMSESGSDVKFNSRLEGLIEKAKSLSMPKEKIENAIKSGAGVSLCFGSSIPIITHSAAFIHHNYIYISYIAKIIYKNYVKIWNFLV